IPPTIASPACLRIYAELSDGTVELCFAQRLQLETTFAAGPAVPPYQNPAATRRGRTLAALPSGRPRRLLIATKTLQPDDATLRALDVVRHLIASHQWAVRLVVSEDGPLRDAFEMAGCPVQMIDPADYFAAKDEAGV